MKTSSTGMAGLALMTLAVGIFASGGTQAADAAQGKSLYEARCVGCHDGSVHERAKRKTKSFGEVRAQVSRWSEQAGGPWSKDEIDSLTLYLNERYYHFRCPQLLCKADQASLQSGSRN